jgi:hypothetical protein
MPRCTVCSHREVVQIDRQLAGVDGVTRDALYRHKRNHLLPLLAETDNGEIERITSDDVLGSVKALLRRTEELLRRAEESRNWPNSRYFIAEARQLLDVMARLRGLYPNPRLGVDISATRGPESDPDDPAMKAAYSAYIKSRRDAAAQKGDGAED